MELKSKLTHGSLKRLNQDPIVFHGSEQESTSQVLRGVVVLCLPGALEMKGLRLYLEGTQKLRLVLRIALNKLVSSL